MKKLATVVGLLLVAAAARPESKNIHETVDPYTGMRMLTLEVSTRTCPDDASPGWRDPEVHVLFTAFEKPDRTVSYLVTPELDESGNVLGLRAHATMDTLIDGRVGSWSTTAGSTTTTRYDSTRSYLHETIPFNVSAADLTTLSTAQWLQFRVNGQRLAVQRCVDARRLRDLAEFLRAASEYGTAVEETSKRPLTPPAQPVKPVKPVVAKDPDPVAALKQLTLTGIPTQPCSGDATPGAPGADVRLNISANKHGDGVLWYFITADISQTPTLNLHGGDRIEMLIDSKASSFNTLNGSRVSSAPDAAGNLVPHETIAFHVHQANLISLSKSAATEFRITGENGSIHRCVQPDQLKHLTEFISLTSRYGAVHSAAVQPRPAH